jgi:hypothetical protein
MPTLVVLGKHDGCCRARRQPFIVCMPRAAMRSRSTSVRTLRWSERRAGPWWLSISNETSHGVHFPGRTSPSFLQFVTASPSRSRCVTALGACCVRRLKCRPAALPRSRPVRGSYRNMAHMRARPGGRRGISSPGGRHGISIVRLIELMRSSDLAFGRMLALSGRGSVINEKQLVLLRTQSLALVSATNEILN